MKAPVFQGASCAAVVSLSCESHDESAAPTNNLAANAPKQKESGKWSGRKMLA